MHQEQHLTAAEEQQHNKQKLKQAKTPQDKKIKSMCCLFIKGERIPSSPQMTSSTNTTAPKTIYFHHAKNKCNAGVTVCWTTQAHGKCPCIQTGAVWVGMCGQTVDNSKWIRREMSPKGCFICVCVCVFVSCFHFELHQHWDLSKGRRAQQGVCPAKSHDTDSFGLDQFHSVQRKLLTVISPKQLIHKT